MDYYSNEASLKATYGDAEVSGMLKAAPGTESQVRLDKACKEAYDVINLYLRSGGYLVPVEFTVFSATEGGTLDGTLQTISDSLSVSSLASSHDLAKKKYELNRAEALAQLSAIRKGELKLDLPKTDTPSGSGDLVVYTRPRVFKKNVNSPSDTLKGIDSAV